MTFDTTQPRLNHVQCLDAVGLHRMAYWEWGDPHNPDVVICVHGLSRQGRDFDGLAKALSSHVRVVCPDVVGRGMSDWLSDPMGYQLPLYVADMVTLLARVNARRVDWVGTSMGGLIGMGVASRHGSPIRKLVINDVGPTLDPAGLLRIASYVGQPLSFASLDEATAHVRNISETFGPHAPSQWLEMTRWQMKQDASGRWVPRGDAAIAVPFKAVTPEMSKLGEALLWVAYDAIVAQTLLIRGAQSDLLSPQTAQMMAQRGPKAMVIEIEGVGHAPMFQHADQISHVQKFLLE